MASENRVGSGWNRYIRAPKAVMAGIAGAALALGGCSSSAEGENPVPTQATTIEQTTPSESVPVTSGSETAEAESDREVIGNKEILTAKELVDLFNNDPASFEKYFKLLPEDFGMTPEQIYNNPQQFAELLAQMSGELNSAVIEMLAPLYRSGGYNGMNSLPEGVTRAQYNEAFRAAAAEALRLSRHCRDHVDEPDETTAVAFDSLQEIYALVVGIIEGYSGLAEEVDVRLELAPYEVTVNGQSVRVALQSAEGNGVSFPETSHPGFSIAGNAADGNRLTTTHVGLNPEDGTLVLGNAEVVPPLFQQ